MMGGCWGMGEGVGRAAERGCDFGPDGCGEAGLAPWVAATKVAQGLPDSDTMLLTKSMLSDGNRPDSTHQCKATQGMAGSANARCENSKCLRCHGS